jgi:hypothetical protein
MTQGQHLAASPILEEHRGASASLHQRGQQTAIAAERRLFTGFGAETNRCCGPTTQASSVAAQQQHRCR